MFLSRDPTIYSLTQLTGNDEGELLVCDRANTKRCSAPVSDIRGRCVPTLLHANRAEYGPGKRIRSFGDLSKAGASSGTGSDADTVSQTSEADDAFDIFPVLPGQPLNGAALNGYGSTDDLSKPKRSVAAAALLAEWDDRLEAGLFRYDVTKVDSKIIPGKHGFIAQLNEGRGSKKRPTEFTIDKVSQPFDEGKFNFKKAAQREVLFAFCPAKEGSNGGAITSTCATGSPNLIFINVSPIEYGHILLVPRVLDDLNQVVDPSVIHTALQLSAAVDDPFFRIGYNSLAAYGTVNHMHFQAYFLRVPFPLERAPTTHLPERFPSSLGGVGIRQLTPGGYPVRGLVFEAGDSRAELASVVGNACQALVAANVPHNMQITDKGARVFLIPNAFSERKAQGLVAEDLLDTQVDPATFEFSGHMPLKRQQDYDTVDEEWCCRLLAAASYEEDRFYRVAALALGQGEE